MDALPLHRRYLVPLVKAYVGRELPGWGRLYDKTIGSYQNDHLWKGEPVEVVTSKFRGYRFLADPGEWSDRMAIFLGRWYDKAALELLAEKIEPGDTVVDIGANYGHFTLAAAAQVGRKGRVLAFEPNPVAFSRMSENLQLEAVEEVSWPDQAMLVWVAIILASKSLRARPKAFARRLRLMAVAVRSAWMRMLARPRRIALASP